MLACFSASALTRCLNSTRSEAATALPSMILAVIWNSRKKLAHKTELAANGKVATGNAAYFHRPCCTANGMGPSPKIAVSGMGRTGNIGIAALTLLFRGLTPSKPSGRNAGPALFCAGSVRCEQKRTAAPLGSAAVFDVA